MKTTLSEFYGRLASFKNFVYETGIADTVRVREPVVSIGNLTVGGTGKTPMVDLVMSHFEKKLMTVGLVARNYKAKLRGTEVIDRHRKNGALEYGDEPWWLAQRHPQALVTVGPVKWFSLWLASQKRRAQVFVIDDGFQHRALHRDLDIVLIDTTASWQEYELLPLGRGRESWDSLQRAHLIVLTKVNWATEDQVERIQARLPDGIPVARARYELHRPEILGQRVFAFAGTAKPNQFHQGLKALTDLDLVGFQEFNDHHIYTENDIHAIEGQAKDAQIILTTEKDFVKVSSLPWTMPVVPVGLNVVFQSGEAEFYASLDSILR